MKNKFLLFALVACFNGFASFGQTQTVPYEYPVKPGSKEWKQLKSGTERMQILTIPPEILQNLSTISLAKTCLNFPLFREITVANNIQQGFTALRNQFNGLSELLSRKDAGSALVGIYEDMNVKGLNKEWELGKQGHYTFTFTCIELLLAQNEIIEVLTKDEVHTLKKLALSKFEDKKELNDVFGPFGLNTTALILAKLLKADGKQQLILKTTSEKDLGIYLNTATFTDEDLLTKIYNASKTY